MEERFQNEQQNKVTNAATTRIGFDPGEEDEATLGNLPKRLIATMLIKIDARS